jgi:hypothetical protein
MDRSDLYDISPVNARFFEPMLCLAVPKLPEGPEWQLELKLDGYRGIRSRAKAAGIWHLATERTSSALFHHHASSQSPFRPNRRPR